MVLVSEPVAWRLYGPKTLAALRRSGLRVERHLMPRGEKAKTWQAVSGLMRDMLRLGLGRDCTLAALGGGSVTDAAGFAAAIYMRGIPWFSLPTTLMGQVDAGIGGKTALDLPEGKNLAGAFHQPTAVVCDTDFLGSLSPRERISGLAEAIKCGLAFEPALLDFIQNNWNALRVGAPGPTERVVSRAAACKMRIVAKDERETTGERELLNFGHTVGHALEATAGFGPLRHGEAVVLGMRAALWLSRRHAGLPEPQAARADGFLGTIPIPRLDLPVSAVLSALQRDKKARKGKPRFVLLRGLGRPMVTAEVPERSVRVAVGSLLEEIR
jgi:3-dehydroquinate synthase